jgi:alanine dehydrogenase
VIVGIPKEIKADEGRVALTPAGAEALRGAGHRVLIEAGAGEGSGISDEEFERAGARIAPDAASVWAQAEMMVKVKEPLPSEYPFLHEGLLLFAFLHLAANPELTHRLCAARVDSVAYETIRFQDGTFPLLAPMSEIAGRMSIQEGAKYLERPEGGRGVLLAGAPGVEPGNVVILGGGVVGKNAAKVAVGMGANVTVLDTNHRQLTYLDDIFGGRLRTLASNAFNVRETTSRADLLVGAVHLPGARAPRLVSADLVRQMKPGAVIVDVAVDQGGCVETIRPTSHRDPTYLVDRVVHYGVPNMPGAVSRTSTFALTNATLPYILELAEGGLVPALKAHFALGEGVNVFRGRVTYPAVAEATGQGYSPLDELLPSAVH